MMCSLSLILFKETARQIRLIKMETDKGTFRMFGSLCGEVITGISKETTNLVG